VKALNDLFYKSDATEAASEAAPGGPLDDLPLWRVQWNALPGERQVYNVHVPHYTALFERLVRGPKPWYFGHILLPGGSENLREPRYSLEGGEDATRLGTVMQLLAVERREDGTLTVVSQGVGRFSVQSVTKSLPHDFVAAEWVLDAEETRGEADAWREFEFGEAGVRLGTAQPSVAEQAPLVPGSAPSGAEEEALAAASVDVAAPAAVALEERVWEALAADLALLTKCLEADGADTKGVSLPPSLLALRPPVDGAGAPESWPSHRRRHRLSFAAPACLGLVEPAVGRQELLDASSTEARLAIVLTALKARAAKLETILAQKLAGKG